MLLAMTKLSLNSKQSLNLRKGRSHMGDVRDFY